MHSGVRTLGGKKIRRVIVTFVLYGREQGGEGSTWQKRNKENWAGRKE